MARCQQQNNQPRSNGQAVSRMWPVKKTIRHSHIHRRQSPLTFPPMSSIRWAVSCGAKNEYWGHPITKYSISHGHNGPCANCERTSHEDDSKKPFSLSSVNEHALESSLSRGEQSLGSTDLNVPLENFFCMKPSTGDSFIRWLQIRNDIYNLGSHRS